MDRSIELSVVVTVVDGGEALKRCLNALFSQQGNVLTEVLVPCDHLAANELTIADEFPQATFLNLGEILDGKIPRNHLEHHEFFDRRRTAALKVAKGALVAIVEDRGVPETNWAEAMMAEYRERPSQVIGGAVVNGVNRIRNWAVFICDFGRFQPPLNRNDPEYVTDTNILYERSALESVRSLWEERYNEAQVNWALRRAGHTLRLTDRAKTTQIRDCPSVWEMLRERFGWARMFGRVRGREISFRRRLVLAMAMPVLPLLLTIRHFRNQLRTGHSIGWFLVSTPFMVLLLIAWAAGEWVGYLDGDRE